MRCFRCNTVGRQSSVLNISNLEAKKVKNFQQADVFCDPRSFTVKTDFPHSHDLVIIE